MAGGRRGRPYQVPEDHTSLQSATIDVDARVGWMLVMSRLHNPGRDLSLGDEFNNALAEVGLQADRSALSRWESGKVTPRYAVLAAYEQALGLRSGQLTSVVNALRRNFSERPNRVWAPVLDPRTDRFHTRLDSLVDTILDGAATGGVWSSFGHHLAATQSMYMPAEMWQRLSGALIDETSRSVGIAYLERFEALRMMLGHSRGARPLLRATAEYLQDPAVQIINDPVGVLEISDLPEAGELLLEMFTSTKSQQVADACVWAIAYKVEMGHYSSTELDQVETFLQEKLKRGSGAIDGFEELLVAMPDSARSRLLGSTGEQALQRISNAAEHGEAIRPDNARRISQRIADQLRATLRHANLYDEDQLTPRIIREALFAFRTDIRHYACLTLLGSPFRAPLARILVEEITAAGWDDPLTPRLVRVLRYLASGEQEETLLGWLNDAPPEIGQDMALAVGHLPQSRRDLGVLAKRLGDGTVGFDRALLYGLGMRQDALLGKLSRDKKRPARVRAAADWWQRTGGAVQD